MKRTSLVKMVLLASLSFSFRVLADEAPNNEEGEEERLSGEWGGKRKEIEDDGLSFDAVYKGDFFKIRNADDQKNIYLANYDLLLEGDGEKLFSKKHSRFLLYVLGNEGDDPNENLGAVQGISNIAAPATWKLYQLWFELPAFPDSDELLVLFGLYDVNSEFDTKRFGGVFINPTHGIGPDFSQSGENGPSIFPTTSAGLRLKTQINENLSGKIAVLDGVPGDPDEPKGTQIKHDKDDGYFAAVEIAWEVEAEQTYKKFALGGWGYTAETEVFPTEQNPDEKAKNFGLYAVAESKLWSEKGSAEQGLGGYIRWGLARQDMNQVSQAYAGALNFTGLFDSRDSDVLGLGFGVSVNSKNLRKAAMDLDEEIPESESIVEITYKIMFSSALSLQLDYQDVRTPGGASGLSDATVLGARLEVRL